MRYFVYVLLCQDSSYYTGITTDVMRRFRLHQLGKGAKYTRSHKPLKIVHTEQYGSKSLALVREHALKSLTHQQKLKLFQDM